MSSERPKDLFNRAPRCDLFSSLLGSDRVERNLLNFLQNVDGVCKHEREGREGGRKRGRPFLRTNPAVLKLYVLGHMPTQRRRHGGGRGRTARRRGRGRRRRAVGEQFTRNRLLLIAIDRSRTLVMPFNYWLNKLTALPVGQF